MVEQLRTNRFSIYLCRMAAIVPAALLVAFAGCHQAPETSRPIGTEVVSTCPSSTSPHYYIKLDRGGYLQERASEHLEVAEVAPLWCGSRVHPTFRLLYLPSHRPATIVSISESERNWLGQSHWTAKTVRFEDPRSDKSIDAAGKAQVTERGELELSAEQVTEFFKSIGSTSFWNADAWRERGVDDGTIILIEGQQDGLYRSVGRWSIDASMFELASVFTRTAKLSVTADLEDIIHRLNKQEGLPSTRQ
jgi:hypothetical protein